MPKGPQGQKRPADTIKNAVLIMRIATKQVAEIDPTAGKNPNAVALGNLGGAKGGKARAANLSKRKLSNIGKKGAAARWGSKS